MKLDFTLQKKTKFAVWALNPITAHGQITTETLRSDQPLGLLV